ncbi:MAG: hypothetical protein ABIF18_02710 [archaeon]
MRKGVILRGKVSFVCLILGVVLVSVFVLAASVAPTDLVFDKNTTLEYDKEGNFTVNWTTGGGDEVNYTIWLSIDGGTSWFASEDNDSATGYSFSNSTDANYTFKIQAINDTLDDANSSLISMVVDTTVPELVYASGMNVDNANVSQNWVFVNITASDTNNATVSYSIYNLTGLWNQTNFVDSYVTTTINWTGLAEGVYYYNVTVNDSATNENSTLTRTITLDVTNPVASASCSPSSGVAGSITCTCSGTDTGGSGINLSLTTASSTPSATGTYTCSVTDYAGNSNTSSASYTITASSSSSTFVPIYRPSESKLSEGYDISLGKNYQVNFRISEQDHILKVNNISTASATITISSDPITLEINIGETKKVDLDDDGYYDLSIYLKDIKFSKANFILTSISEAVSSSDSTVQDEEVGDGEIAQDGVVAEGVAEVDEESNYMIWIIILAIVLVVIGVVFAKNFKKFKE